MVALGEKFGADALRTAVIAALSANVHSYAYVRLASGRRAFIEEPVSPRAGWRQNVRGSAYYH